MFCNDAPIAYLMYTFAPRFYNKRIYCNADKALIEEVVAQADPTAEVTNVFYDPRDVTLLRYDGM